MLGRCREEPPSQGAGIPRLGPLVALGLVSGLLVAWGSSVDAQPEHEPERVPARLGGDGVGMMALPAIDATPPRGANPNPWPALPAALPTAPEPQRRPSDAVPLAPEIAARCLADAWHEAHGVPLGSAGLGVLWAHWALETGRGNRMVAYNFGGIKGSSPLGNSVRLWTREREGNGHRRVQRRFRAYRSLQAGARDYLSLLARRYPRALRAVERGRVIDFVHALDRGGYFTDDVRAYQRALTSLYSEFVTSAKVAASCSP